MELAKIVCFAWFPPVMVCNGIAPKPHAPHTHARTHAHTHTHTLDFKVRFLVEELDVRPAAANWDGENGVFLALSRKDRVPDCATWLRRGQGWVCWGGVGQGIRTWGEGS